MGRAITPESMTLAARTGGNALDFAPGRFKVYGSNSAIDWNSTNSNTWILLFSQTTTTTYPSLFRTFSISTNTAYQYYALHITHTMGQEICFFSEWDIVGTFSQCQTCPGSSLSLQGSTSVADCVLACPARQFQSELASNVARMCGPAQNESCPVALSTVLDGSPATMGNDGLFTFVAHSQVTDGPHTFRIDLERMRNINYIKFYNRVDLFESRITGALILVGSSALWANNTICATLNINAVQVHNCKMSGKYIFIVAKTADALNFLELQVFSNCITCPATAISLPGSTSPASCGCPAGSFEETRVLNPPYASRSYSSVFTDQHSASLLDDSDKGTAWLAKNLNSGQWMEIDVDMPMYIVGIITQGRGVSEHSNQYVKEFRVEYRLGDALGVGVIDPATIDIFNTQGYQRTIAYQQKVHEVLGIAIPHVSEMNNFGTFCLVRYLPVGSARWHDATDNLLGTNSAYGTPDNYDAQWNFKFDDPSKTEMFVCNSDFTQWVNFMRTSIDSTFTMSARPVIASSLDQTPHNIKWDNRGSNPEDPWITVRNRDFHSTAQYVYGEAGKTLGYDAHQRGSLVFVRNPGKFSMTNGLKKEHIFPAPIYARYIRIVVLQWNNHISMRAALIVKSCSSCIANAVSLEGSTAENACECRADAYKSTSDSNTRAIALVPGQAQFSTLANRNQRFYATTAVFDRTIGLLGNITCRPTFDLVARYSSGTSDILNDSSTYANHLGKWALVAPDSPNRGWTGSPRIALLKSHPEWNLQSYENENHALMNTLVLPGIMRPGITDGGFYRSSANVFDVADFGSKCMAYSFWIRPVPLVYPMWEQVIFASSDEKFTISFFFQRYDFYLAHLNLLLGDTHSLFIPDTWTHVTIQVGLDGMHYLHIDGVAIFSRSMFSVEQFASIDAFKTQTGYTNAIERGISLSYGQDSDTHIPMPPMTQETAPAGPINIGGFYADGFYSRGRTQMYLEALISDFRVYHKSQLLTQYEVDCLYAEDAPRPVTGDNTRFDRALSQYIDGGPHTFNIATNGGFTAVAVVKLTGTPVSSERIFDFGKGQDNDNILMCRAGPDSKRFYFGIWNGNSACFVQSADVFDVNVWKTVIMKYTSTTKIMELRIGSNSVSATCAVARTDRQVVNSYVGKSNWANDVYLQGSIAGLYAVDPALSEAEISSIISKMYQGEDTLQTCQTCLSNGISLQGSTSVTNCTSNCPTGYSGTECTVCVDGYYAVSAGICSPMCPADTYRSTDTSNVARACGPAHDENCPAYITSTWDNDFRAALGNDGSTTNVVHSKNNGVNWFRIDFQGIRHLETIRYYNRQSETNKHRATHSRISVSNSSSWSASNTQCATLSDAQVQDFDCPLFGRYLFLYQNNEYLQVAKLEAYAPTCLACPTNAISLQGSTSVDACSCQAGSYKETRVLNPPYAQRSYSGIHGGDHFHSLLDDMYSMQSWTPKYNIVGEYMEFDAGEPMYIAGIITQGRGYSGYTHQWVKEFRVEYRLGSDIGDSMVLPGTFSMPDALKKEHVFTTPIYAQYVRIIVLDWNSHIGMRAALIVNSCSSCFATAVSVQGSLSPDACECPAGAYKHVSASSNEAIALVPGQAQLSTLANRNQRLYASTAVFDSTAGPVGSKGAVTFDRAFSQYIDGGAHTILQVMGGSRRWLWSNLQGKLLQMSVYLILPMVLLQTIL